MVENVVDKVLIAGCGDLGAAIAKQLHASGIKTIGLRRGLQAIAGVEMVRADVTRAAGLAELASLKPQIIIYCIAASGQSDEAYQAAYVHGLRNVLATQIENDQLRHVFFVSSTRVYGQDTDLLLDESVKAQPADFGGERLLEAERLLHSLRCGATVLRLSGIYGPGRLRMIKLAESPSAWPEQNMWSNRIHRDDAAAFIVTLVKQAIAGMSLKSCYIVTDSQPVTQHEVLCWLAVQMGMAVPESIPPAEGGKRLSNREMLATGFKLKYPSYQSGYATLLATAQE